MDNMELLKRETLREGIFVDKETLVGYFREGLSNEEINSLTGLKFSAIKKDRNEYNKEIGVDTAFDSNDSKSDQAYKLIAKGRTNEEVVEMTGLSLSTIRTYRSKYKKKQATATSGSERKEAIRNMFENGTELTVVAERFNLKESTVNNYYRQYVKDKKAQEAGVINVVDSECAVEAVKSSELRFGSCVYLIDTYMIENVTWLNLSEIEQALKEEINFDFEDIDYVINSRYLLQHHVNGETVTLIDKSILMEIASVVNDHRLIQAVIELYKPRDNMFYKIANISQALNDMQEVPRNIRSLDEKVRLFNDIQLDLLHEICNAKSSDLDFEATGSNVKTFLDDRRKVKNDLGLAFSVKNSLQLHNISNDMLKDMQASLDATLNALYLKKYNPRTGGVEGWKKDVVSKYI